MLRNESRLWTHTTTKQRKYLGVFAGVLWRARRRQTSAGYYFSDALHRLLLPKVRYCGVGLAVTSTTTVAGNDHFIIICVSLLDSVLRYAHPIESIDLKRFCEKNNTLTLSFFKIVLNLASQLFTFSFVASWHHGAPSTTKEKIS